MLPFSHMSENTNIIWKALADVSRRKVMDHLREQPMTTGDICALFPNLTRFAVMKHLRVLEKAKLITIRREGKFRWNYLNAVPIQEIYERWVRKYENQWSSQLLQLKKFVEQNPINTMEKQLSSVRVAVEINIDAPKEMVWDAITDKIGLWWRKDFLTSSKAKSFKLEPKLGGMMYEDFGNGEGLVWAKVIGIDAPNVIQLRGNLAAEFGGPATSFLKIALVEKDKGCTLQLTDDLFGAVSENTKKSQTEGWKVIFGQALKSFVEKN